MAITESAITGSKDKVLEKSPAGFQRFDEITFGGLPVSLLTLSKCQFIQTTIRIVNERENRITKKIKNYSLTDTGILIS